MSWAADEFAGVDLGDKRLDSRLVKLCDSLSEAPESPINQACEDWGESKAAYRFFQNEKVDCDQIMSSHQAKTLERACDRQVVLAVQDTSYFIYTNHYKTEGLGKISTTKGRHGGETHSRGLVMHTCMALTTNLYNNGGNWIYSTSLENQNHGNSQYSVRSNRGAFHYYCFSHWNDLG